jgi:adenosylcobinamide kinase / adenosylcobinamide-phosphate guanylyltransferase
MHELILGGQKSGKSRAAEARTAGWLREPQREALLIATAEAGDQEMAARIARHRAERAARVPGLVTHEEPRDVPQTLAHWCAPTRLVVVDCLTLWLTQLAMPLHGGAAGVEQLDAARDALVAALRDARGPVLLVSNEIGLGLTPLTTEARRAVDALGALHQAVAAVCDRVTLMVAGCELVVKEPR